MDFMALRQTFLRGQYARQWCQYKDGIGAYGALRDNHNRKVSPCFRQAEDGCSQQPRLNRFRSSGNLKIAQVNRTFRIIGLLFSCASENKKLTLHTKSQSKSF